MSPEYIAKLPKYIAKDIVNIHKDAIASLKNERTVLINELNQFDLNHLPVRSFKIVLCRLQDINTYIDKYENIVDTDQLLEIYNKKMTASFDGEEE